MKITRRQLRKLLTEATVDYVDNEGSRRAEKASDLLSNNSLRLQLQGFYNDAYERILPHQMDIIGDKNPDFAKELAHDGAVNYAREDIVDYIETSLMTKYGKSAIIKFGENDFTSEMPNQYIQLSDIIKNSNSNKIKYDPIFKDFPDNKQKNIENLPSVGSLNIEDITDEEYEQELSRRSNLSQERSLVGDNISDIFQNTVPRSEYPDETTSPGRDWLNLDDIMNDTTSPKGR